MFVAFSPGIGEDTFSRSVFLLFYSIVYEARTGQRECTVRVKHSSLLFFFIILFYFKHAISSANAILSNSSTPRHESDIFFIYSDVLYE